MVNRLVLGLFGLVAVAAGAQAADLGGPQSAAPRIWTERVVGFEPALIDRVDVVRLPPARRFVVFEDEPAVLYPAPLVAPRQVYVRAYDASGIRYNRPIRFEPALYHPPCLC